MLKDNLEVLHKDANSGYSPIKSITFICQI